jgi:hypothetical protein
MPSVINCPACERRLNVPEALVGEAVKCPTCGETFTADLDSPPPRREELDKAPLRLKEEDEPAPRRRRPPDRDGEDDERDDVRRPRPRRGRAKPSQISALGVMMLIGGIFGVLIFLGMPLASGGLCCLWPGTYYSLVMGILAIVKGSQLLGDDAHRMPPPRTTAVLMIINIVTGDVPNLAMGIVCLCLLNDPEVESFFRG